MLAQSFLSAADLAIPEPARAALILTLNALERGELQHCSMQHIARCSDAVCTRPKVWQFNMVHWNRTYAECGTVCCIGGSAELLGNLELGSLDRLSDNNEQLFHLFYPGDQYDSIAQYDSITPAQAAIALRSYLTTGKVDWSLARTA